MVRFSSLNSSSLALLIGASLLCFSASAAFSQTILVTGKVVSSDDKQPLAGVNVTLKSHATVGTVTNNNGIYSISVPADSSVLIFSYIGFTSVEEPVTNRSMIDVVLNPEITPLSEVVVVGYGTQLKKDLTGVISTVSEKDFNKGSFTSPDQLIQGRE